MTNEEAKEILAIYRFNLIQSVSNQLEEDIEALDIAIKALEKQPNEDCRNCKKWDECPCGKEGHENGTSIGYSIGECKDYEQQPYEDAINRDDVIELITGTDETDGNEPVFSGKQVIEMLKGLPSITLKAENEVKPHKTCYYCYYNGSDIQPECIKCRQKFDVGW